MLFISLYTDYITDLDLQDRYVAGLDKIAFAESQVGQMQHELEVLQPQLVIAKEENAT